ncbi:MAG: methyltransferase domain-containing protein [Hyphomicrobium sp.]
MTSLAQNARTCLSSEVDAIAPTAEQAAHKASTRNEALFRDALHLHLSERPAKEIDFFINRRRFDLMLSAIGSELARRPLRILNAACGPFAFEFYVRPEGAVISAFDFDEQLAEIHDNLVRANLIAPCSFRLLDVADFTPAALYNVVLVNDLFYSKHVDFFAVIAAFAASVAPGGVIYFDIQDERAGPVWRLLGKGNTTRRYNLNAVRSTLEHLGLKVEAVHPALGIKGGADSFVRKILWNVFGIANNFAFVARR